MNDLLDPIEPALCEAREHLRAKEPQDVPAHLALRAARDYLELHRDPDMAEYDPHELVAAILDRVSTDRMERDLRHTSRRVGDPVQIATALRTILEHVVLEADAILLVTLLEEADVPLVRVEFDGPGQVPSEWLMNDSVAITLEDLEPRWTVATRGGRFDRTARGLNLRLKGIRVVPETKSCSQAVLDAVRDAERRMRLVTGGGANDLEVERAAASRATVEALRLVDAESRGMEPGDVAAVLKDVTEVFSKRMTDRSITLETHVERPAPPIKVHRRRLWRFFANTLEHACLALPRGGRVSMLLDYHASSRHLEMLIDLEGTQYESRGSHLLASMRRAILDVHGGTLEPAVAKSGVTFTVTLPDPVGRALDDWIPGFERFSERSRQMLRLLKSGGPTPPEQFLLEGVLEEELERWLLPRLSIAPATTLAHGLTAVASELPGSSAERLAKALGQVRKGKPKKEICKPAYAGEILWAFRVDDRHRTAVGTDRLDASDLRSLCEALLRTPPDNLASLRTLAKALPEA